MTTLKEFIAKNHSVAGSEIKELNSSAGLVPFENSERGIIEILMHETDFSRKDVEKFSHEVTAMLASEDTLDLISNLLGEPREYESEDEFVARAKQTMSTVLKSKFALK